MPYTARASLIGSFWRSLHCEAVMLKGSYATHVCRHGARARTRITNLQLQGEICRSLRVDGSAVEMNSQWALPLDLALFLPQAALYRLEGLTLLEMPFQMLCACRRDGGARIGCCSCSGQFVACCIRPSWTSRWRTMSASSQKTRQGMHTACVQR